MKTVKTRLPLVLVAALGIASWAHADGPVLNGKALTNSTTKDSNRLPDVTGKVQDVDTGAHVIEVKADSSYTRIVKVDSTTQVLKGGQAVQVADIREGDTVTLHSN